MKRAIEESFRRMFRQAECQTFSDKLPRWTEFQSARRELSGSGTDSRRILIAFQWVGAFGLALADCFG